MNLYFQTNVLRFIWLGGDKHKYLNTYPSDTYTYICAVLSFSVMSNALWPQDCSLSGTSVDGLLQARMLEWVAMPFSRGIFPTQRSNSGLLHCSRILYHLSHQGSLYIYIYIYIYTYFKFIKLTHPFENSLDCQLAARICCIYP